MFLKTVFVSCRHERLKSTRVEGMFFTVAVLSFMAGSASQTTGMQITTADMVFHMRQKPRGRVCEKGRMVGVKLHHPLDGQSVGFRLDTDGLL